MSIALKGKILTLSIIVGFAVTGVLFNLTSSKLSKNYNETAELLMQEGQLKDMIIGGLLFNSAKGVVFGDSSQSKAKKTMKKGIKKLTMSARSFRKLESASFKSFENEYDDMVKYSNFLINKVNSGSKMTKEESKLSLKKWRALKFKVIPLAASINKKAKKRCKITKS